jgi:hypothetical protein
MQPKQIHLIKTALIERQTNQFIFAIKHLLDSSTPLSFALESVYSWMNVFDSRNPREMFTGGREDIHE